MGLYRTYISKPTFPVNVCEMIHLDMGFCIVYCLHNPIKSCDHLVFLVGLAHWFPKSWRIIIPDLPAHGDTTYIPGGDYSQKGIVQQIHKVRVMQHHVKVMQHQMRVMQHQIYILCNRMEDNCAIL